MWIGSTIVITLPAEQRQGIVIGSIGLSVSQLSQIYFYGFQSNLGKELCITQWRKIAGND